jgi:hypothetical protein
MLVMLSTLAEAMNENASDHFRNKHMQTHAWCQILSKCQMNVCKNVLFLSQLIVVCEKMEEMEAMK